MFLAVATSNWNSTLLRARELLGAQGVVVEIDADDREPGAAVGLGDAIERFELRAAGVARTAPEANYHHFAAVLGETHVLAGEAARDQVGRRLAEQLVFLGRGGRAATQPRSGRARTPAQTQQNARAMRTWAPLTNKRSRLAQSKGTPGKRFRIRRNLTLETFP